MAAQPGEEVLALCLFNLSLDSLTVKCRRVRGARPLLIGIATAAEALSVVISPARAGAWVGRMEIWLCGVYDPTQAAAPMHHTQAVSAALFIATIFFTGAITFFSKVHGLSPFSEYTIQESNGQPPI